MPFTEELSCAGHCAVWRLQYEWYMVKEESQVFRQITTTRCLSTCSVQNDRPPRWWPKAQMTGWASGIRKGHTEMKTVQSLFTHQWERPSIQDGLCLPITTKFQKWQTAQNVQGLRTVRQAWLVGQRGHQWNCVSHKGMQTLSYCQEVHLRVFKQGNDLRIVTANTESLPWVRGNNM